jgi:L-seryl-tRNA(Ser) seleniumtransferase
MFMRMGDPAPPSDAATPASLQQRLQALPSVDEMTHWPPLALALQEHGHAAVVRAARACVARARQSLRAGHPAEVTPQDVLDALSDAQRPRLRAVINATGVVLHTNLGRAPLPERALQAALDVGRGYSNLEFDLDKGERGSRYDHARDVARVLWGAEDALVVNNCAAAVLLALSSLAAGREAVISRGELVEIGGGFRVPEVVVQGGARLREVGTTNKTRLADYEDALGPDTAVLLKVHRSNFALVGFTQSVSTAQLAGLAKARGVPLLVDLGTGLTAPLPVATPDGEDTVTQTLKDGASLVMASGDKLLGGPQAGLILGRADLVDRCRRHPLCRALRVDKMTLAALEVTLRLHLDQRHAEIPAVAMMHLSPDVLRPRAQALASTLAQAGVPATVRDVTARPGGGTLPTVELPSVAVALSGGGGLGDRLAHALRQGDPPVVARVEGGEVLLDVRCVPSVQDAALANGVLLAWARVTGKGNVSSC